MKFIKRIIFLVIAICFVICGSVVYDGYKLYTKAIEEKSISERVDEIRSKEKYCRIDELPQIYIDAVIAVEDHRFFKHKGVDIISIGRAIKTDIATGSFAEGGSTITQQVAKNMIFTQEKNLTRKVAEVFAAYQLEKEYSKNEILEIYLNTSYFGDGYYTVKEATLGYFSKEPKDMTDYESIMLAGIPNAPSVYAPTKNPELAKQRQRQVADAMVKHKYFTEEEINDIINNK